MGTPELTFAGANGTHDGTVVGARELKSTAQRNSCDDIDESNIALAWKANPEEVARGTPKEGGANGKLTMNKVVGSSPGIVGNIAS